MGKLFLSVGHKEEMRCLRWRKPVITAVKKRVCMGCSDGNVTLTDIYWHPNEPWVLQSCSTLPAQHPRNCSFGTFWASAGTEGMSVTHSPRHKAGLTGFAICHRFEPGALGQAGHVLPSQTPSTYERFWLSATISPAWVSVEAALRGCRPRPGLP